MRRLLTALTLAVLGLGLGAGAATADPSITLCHDVHIVVNGSDVLNDASCNTAP